VSGGTLDRIVHSGVLLPVRQVGEIMAQLLQALDHAHSKGIIHRDIKPSNILCHSAASIKVADFGVACLDTLDATGSSGVVPIGTPNYMAPERFVGRKADARTDIFSAGVVLFQLLTGARPYNASDVQELASKLMSRLPPSVTSLRPELWLALDNVTQRALARNPQDRFQTAQAFLEGLNAAIEAGTKDSTPPLDLTSFATPASEARSGQGSPTPSPLGLTMAERLLPTTLQALEQTLAQSIGPIARVLIRRAASEATNATELLDALSAPIQLRHEAARFRRLGERVLLEDARRTDQEPGEAIQVAEADAVVAALVPLIGPIARPLVIHHSRTAIGRDDFYDRLGRELTNERHRTRLHELRVKLLRDGRN
jgi:serine/threonine-protein kinase